MLLRYSDRSVNVIVHLFPSRAPQPRPPRGAGIRSCGAAGWHDRTRDRSAPLRRVFHGNRRRTAHRPVAGADRSSGYRRRRTCRGAADARPHPGQVRYQRGDRFPAAVLRRQARPRRAACRSSSHRRDDPRGHRFRAAFHGAGEAAELELRSPIRDAPAGITYSVESPSYGRIVIGIEGVPLEWGWSRADGVETVAAALHELAAALADVMDSYNRDGPEVGKRFFGSVRVHDVTLVW